jgi:hypothetical protein
MLDVRPCVRASCLGLERRYARVDEAALCVEHRNELRSPERVRFLGCLGRALGCRDDCVDQHPHACGARLERAVRGRELRHRLNTRGLHASTRHVGLRALAVDEGAALVEKWNLDRDLCAVVRWVFRAQ